MIKFFSQVIVLLFVSHIGVSQVNDILIDSGFEVNGSTTNAQFFTDDQVKEFVLSQSTDQQKIVIGGQVSSIFHEVIDDLTIYIKIEGLLSDSVRTKNGLYAFLIENTGKRKLLDIYLIHPDFHTLDTAFIFSGSEPMILSFMMVPKHKILLRGRVHAGNIPIENANVEIIHAGESHYLKTFGCFYDDEDYWNCIFDGMFKQELITIDPTDSIKLIITSKGMKAFYAGMTFMEYSGEVMQIKMKYASRLPEMPANNLNLKLAFPFTSSDHGWVMDISYYRLLNKTNLKRIAWGIDGSIYVSSVSVSYPTFPDLEPSTSDRSYITGFLGPSLLFWILSPDRRSFSSYTGCTFAVQFNNPQFVFQPFIGTRYFLDINKALSLEFRYSEYNRDITHYVFNPYGNATTYIKSEHFVNFHINLGIQVVF